MAAPAAPPKLPPEPVDAVRRGGVVFMVVQAILVAIASSLVLARLVVRSIIIKRVGLDDLFIVIGLLFSISYFIITGIMNNERTQSVKNGPPLYVPEIFVDLKLQEMSQPVSILSITFTRISICFFLLRIFRTDRRWRRGLYAIALFAFVTGVATAVITVTQCHPIQKLWYPLLPGTCWAPQTVVIIGDVQGAIAVVCDWILATLPIVFMWNLQMSTKLKAGICVLMGMGYFTGVCTIVKTILLKNVILKEDGSITWGLVDLAIWVALESDIGIIAATIPTLRPLFDKAMRQRRKSSRERNRYWSRSSNTHYLRKRSRDSISRQLDDEQRLHRVELSSIQPPLPTAQPYPSDDVGIPTLSAFASDEASFKSRTSETGATAGKVGSSGRPNDGGFYEHEEEVFGRV